MSAQMQQMKDMMELQHDHEVHEQEIEQAEETHTVDLDFLKEGNAIRMAASRSRPSK